MRFCTFSSAAENVWHILDVSANSPAAQAGLQPYADYVIGTTHKHLSTQEDFFRLVEERQGEAVRLLVYNRQWDTCREVIIVPNRNWGGEGSIGCDVGYGYFHNYWAQLSGRDSYLHRVPSHKERLGLYQSASSPVTSTFSRPRSGSPRTFRSTGSPHFLLHGRVNGRQEQAEIPVEEGRPRVVMPIPFNSASSGRKKSPSFIEPSLSFPR